MKAKDLESKTEIKGLTMATAKLMEKVKRLEKKNKELNDKLNSDL